MKTNRLKTTARIAVNAATTAIIQMVIALRAAVILAGDLGTRLFVLNAITGSYRSNETRDGTPLGCKIGISDKCQISPLGSLIAPSYTLAPDSHRNDTTGIPNKNTPDENSTSSQSACAGISRWRARSVHSRVHACIRTRSDRRVH